jgi:hypothetical protein
MAYISQEKKAALAPGIKAVLKKYGMKGTIATRHNSTLICNISAGPLDIIGNMYEIAAAKPGTHYNRNPGKPTHIDVNVYWISENYSGRCKEFLEELIKAMKGTDWYDRSDIQTDYFDTAWYNTINVGKWDKAYQLTK